MATKKPRGGTTTQPARSRKAAIRGARTTPRPASREGPTAKMLPAGTPAPDFTLQSAPAQTVSLSEFRGRPVILAFYPADWSPVCGDQLALYNEILPEFQRLGAELIGISVDGVWCHAAFAEQRHLHFPLLADFEPKGEIARKYGVFAASQGVSNRALFVIDRSGTIRWSYLSPMGVNPGADGILAALESMDERARSDKEVQAGGRSSKTAKRANRGAGGRTPLADRSPAPSSSRRNPRTDGTPGVSRERAPAVVLPEERVR